MSEFNFQSMSLSLFSSIFPYGFFGLEFSKQKGSMPVTLLCDVYGVLR